MMKNYFKLIILLAAISTSTVAGQARLQQAGFRFGYRSGIFYQVSSEAGNAEVAFNALVSFRREGIQVTGLKVIYETALNNISPDLFFGWGYGGHLGFVYSDHLKFRGDDYYFYRERFCPLMGIDGWLTAEYRVFEIPLDVSLNLKPFIEFTTPSFVRIVPWDFAISISYVF